MSSSYVPTGAATLRRDASESAPSLTQDGYGTESVLVVDMAKYSQESRGGKDSMHFNIPQDEFSSSSIDLCQK